MQPGEQLGEFVLRGQVAHSATGVVFRAKHTGTGGDAAIKILDGATRELNTVARLCHRNIVPVLDGGTVGDRTWLAMPWMKGGTLRERGARDWRRIREALVAILGALSHAHASGLLHRDVKPENVLWDGQRWRVSDFGIAFEMRAPEPEDRSPGTPYYAAPEQIVGATHLQRPWTDLYGTACVAWELTTGRPPFTGEHREILRGHCQEPPPDFDPRVSVPDDLEDWLRILLDKDPTRRAVFAADALAALPTGGGAGRRIRSSVPPSPHQPTFDLDDVDLDLDDLPLEEVAATLPAPAVRGPLPPAPPEPKPPALITEVLPPEASPTLAATRSRYVPAHPEDLDALWRQLLAVRGTGRGTLIELHATRQQRVIQLIGRLTAESGQALMAPIMDPAVRPTLRAMAGMVAGRDSREALRGWTANAPDNDIDRWHDALQDAGPLRADHVLGWLARVATGRVLVVVLGCPTEPEQLALAEAITGADGPVLGLLATPEPLGRAAVIALRRPPAEELARTLRTITPMSADEAIAHAVAHPDPVEAIAVLHGR